MDDAERGIGLVTQTLEAPRVDGAGVAGDWQDELPRLVDVLAFARDLEPVHVREVVLAICELADPDFQLGDREHAEVLLGCLGDAAHEFPRDGIELGDLLGDRHHALTGLGSEEIEDDLVGRRRVFKDVVEEREDDRVRVVVAVLDEADGRTTRMFEHALAVVAELVAMRGFTEPVRVLDELELLRRTSRQHVKELVAIHDRLPFCG